MWRNYLTVGIRALAKNRVYAAINIVGLALGMAACLLILTFVRYEFSYDAGCPNADRTSTSCRPAIMPTPEGGERDEAAADQLSSSGAALKKDFPQIENVVCAVVAERDR